MYLNKETISDILCDLYDIRNMAILEGFGNLPKDNEGTETTIFDCLENCIEIMIKLGSNVKSKIHDDLTGHVVVYQPLNNYAVVMTDIIEYEMMTVECYLSDLEAV